MEFELTEKVIREFLEGVYRTELIRETILQTLLAGTIVYHEGSDWRASNMRTRDLDRHLKALIALGGPLAGRANAVRDSMGWPRWVPTPRATPSPR